MKLYKKGGKPTDLIILACGEWEYVLELLCIYE